MGGFIVLVDWGLCGCSPVLPLGFSHLRVQMGWRSSPCLTEYSPEQAFEMAGMGVLGRGEDTSRRVCGSSRCVLSV